MENYKLLKYLMEKEYIYFVDNSRMSSDWTYSFGAGTSIKKKSPVERVTLDLKLKYEDSLRTEILEYFSESFRIEGKNREGEFIFPYIGRVIDKENRENAFRNAEYCFNREEEAFRNTVGYFQREEGGLFLYSLMPFSNVFKKPGKSAIQCYL